MEEFRKSIAFVLKKAIGKEAKELDEEKIIEFIELPPQAELGDFAFPCFKLSSAMKKSPSEIAAELQQKIALPKEFSKIEAKGGYLNFFLKKEVLAEKILEKILKEKESYGKSADMKKKKVMVEYSAPNTNKPLHLGHLRNDSIGMAVSKLFESQNFKVIKANLYSNRGVHICKSILAYKKWGNNAKPEKEKPDYFVGKYYTMFSEKAKENPALEEEALGMLNEWEKGNKEVRQLWKQMDEWAISGFKQTYKEFGSEFDVEFRESDFYGKSKPIIELGLKKGIFEKGEKGEIVADLEKFGFGKKTIMRADGTSIYITNDLALTKHKFEHFKLDKALWVVASEQNLYFTQLFKIFELLGYSWAKDCKHLNYGMVFLPEGKMKSREGRVVEADMLIEEMKKLAEKEILERHPELEKKQLAGRAKAIALSAIKFYLLKTDAAKDILFVPEESLSFEGDTGPYVQYAFARCAGILKKAKEESQNSKDKKPKNKQKQAKTQSQKINFSLLELEEEKNLLKKLMLYHSVLSSSLGSLSPHILCQYLLELTASFNSFYDRAPVLNAEKEELKNARIALVKAASIVLENGLNALNIEAVKEM